MEFINTGLFSTKSFRVIAKEVHGKSMIKCYQLCFTSYTHMCLKSSQVCMALYFQSLLYFYVHYKSDRDFAVNTNAIVIM